MAVIVNVNRGKGSKPAQPRDFNPFIQKPKKKPTAGSIIAQIMPAAIVKQWDELAKLKDEAKKTGDWSAFNRRSEEMGAGC